MKTTKILTAAVAIIALVFTQTSCEETSLSGLFTISQAEEASFVDNLLEEVTLDVEEVVMAETTGTLKVGGINDGPRQGGGMGNGCATITREYPEGTDFPRVITIDFGDEGCASFREMMQDSVIKTGKMIVTITDLHYVAGSQRIVTFDNFRINGNLIEGTQTTTNEGENEDGFPIFTTLLENGTVTTNEGIIIERTMTRTRTMFAGSDTPRERMDDSFTIEGNSSGINSDGETYTRLITIPIISARTCPFYLSGEVTCTIGEDEVIINYGTGECDNIATKTINGGEPEEFELEAKYHPKRVNNGEQGKHNYRHRRGNS